MTCVSDALPPVHRGLPLSLSLHPGLERVGLAGGLDCFAPRFDGGVKQKAPRRQGVVTGVGLAGLDKVEEPLNSPCATMRPLPCFLSQYISLTARKREEAGKGAIYMLPV